MSTNCYLNKMQLKFNEPPPRLSLISPYEGTTYTKEDFDMRRKAEILKYQAQSTKANSKLTKKQKFAQIVKGTAVKNFNTGTVCASTDNIIKTSSSSSNVPGKAIQLYLDPSVPLYNFANSITNTLGELQKDILLPWRFYPNTQTTSLPSENGEVINIATLEIMRAIVNPISKFSITIPYTPSSDFTSLSTVTMKILFGGTEIAYLNKIPDPIINTIVNTIIFSDIYLYTSPGYFYEFYVGASSLSNTMLNGTVQITEHNLTPLS
jgi:hypothetical protein